MTARSHRHIRVFISSSFAHKEARELIKRTLESENATELSDDMPSVYITGHLHEKDGYSNLTAGVSSQKLINAYSEECNAFILYAGDKIGEFTIAEFENVVANAKRNYHFIFVVYNPEDKIVEQEGTKYFSWEYFKDNHLKRSDGVEYYHRQTTGAELETTFKAIRTEIASQAIVPLYPCDMDYGRMLTAFQQQYRNSGTFYLPREIDKEVAAFLNDTDSLLGIVTGMSLAGKTRVVIENLKILTSDKVRIHYLSSDSDAPKIIGNLNFKMQFPEGLRHILFVDEINELFFRPIGKGQTFSKEELQAKMQSFLISGNYEEAASIARQLQETDDEDSSRQSISTRFLELVQFASDHPGRLTIVGTTVMPFNEFMNIVRSRANAAPWLDRCQELPIRPMTKAEVWTEVRRLRALNQISGFDTRRIHEGLPLGALFAPVDRFKNIYGSLQDKRFAKRIFDAIKTLWLWKNRNRNNPTLLLDFINDAYPCSTRLDIETLFKNLRPLSALIILRGTDDYTYETEDILVDEVFRFQCELEENASQDDAYRKAVDRIIGYIDRHMPGQKFQQFSKLCMRLQKRTTHPYLFDHAVERIKGLYPPEKLTDTVEEIRMSDSNVLNGVHLWIDKIVQQAIRSGHPEEGRRLYSLFPTDWILAEVLDDPSNREYYRPELFSHGHIVERYASTKCHTLLNTLMEMADFNEALYMFSIADFDSIASASIAEKSFDENYYNFSLRNKVRSCFNILLGKAVSFRDLTEKALFYLKARNSTRISNGLAPLFRSDSEMLLDFINTKAWEEFSIKVTSHDLPEVFDMVLAVAVPEGREYDGLRLNKAFILNNLMKPMSPPVAFEAWLKMGKLKDSYTLMNIISKCPDFSHAYGFVESFMNESGKGRIRLGSLFANKLLDTAAHQAELDECEKLYRRLGLLTEEDIEKASAAGIPALCILRDEAVHVHLLKKDFIPLEMCHKVLRYMKDNNYGHNSNLLSNLVYRTLDFSDAYNLVYGSCDFISEESQSLMRIDPVVISLLARKAKKEDDARLMNNILNVLIDEAVKTPEEETGILDPNNNILSEYLKNPVLASGYDEACDFLSDLRARTGIHLDSPFIDRPLLFLLWNENPGTPKVQKIKQTNEYILNHTGIPRKDLRSLTHIRYTEGKKAVACKKNPPVLYNVDEYPFINKNGSWESKEMTRLDFLINMMEHRFAHPGSLRFALAQLASVSPKKTEAYNKARTTCNRLLDLAVKTNLLLDFDSYVSVRSSLEVFKDTTLHDKLFAIATNYSLMKDLCYNLHEGEISYPDAMSKIEELEDRYKIRLYRTTAFYDAVLHRLTLDSDETVDSIIAFRDNNFPHDDPWTEEQKYFLLHKTRTVDEFEKLRKLFVELPEAWPTALLTAVKQASYSHTEEFRLLNKEFGTQQDSWPADRLDCIREKIAIKDKLIAYLLQLDEKDGKVIANPLYGNSANPSVTIGLYSYFDRMNFDKLYLFIVDNSLAPDSEGFQFLTMKVKTVVHLGKMEKLKGFSWTAKTAGSLLDNLSHNRFFQFYALRELLAHIQKNLLPTLRNIYQEEKRINSDEQFVRNCWLIYNKYKHISPADTRQSNLLDLASICWEIVRRD